MVNTKFSFEQDFFKEENKCGYKVSVLMKEVLAVELDLLNEFMNICDKYNLKYWADAGTLLGCARHKGFIPWDDDIDLIMPRTDYDKFLKIALKELKTPYFLQTEKTDQGRNIWFAKICNSDTTAMFRSYMDKDYPFNQGINIDIFPLDNVPDDKSERAKFFAELKENEKKAKRFADCTYRYVFHTDISNKSFNFVKLFKNCAKVLIRTLLVLLHIQNPYSKKVCRLAQKYNKIECKCFSTNVFNPNDDVERGCLQKSDFLETVYLPFEMVKLPCPKNYDAVLRNYYGNWNDFVMGTAYHSNVFYDTNKSYKEYVNHTVN